MEQKKTEGSVLSTGTSVSDHPSWLYSLCSQIRESYSAARNPQQRIQITARPDPQAANLLIAEPTTLRSVAGSIRAMVEDWRNPRAYTMDPAEVRDIWSKKRYRAQIVSFAGYAALIGVLYAARTTTPSDPGREAP